MSPTILGAIVGAASAIIGSIVTGIIAEVIKGRLAVKQRNHIELIAGCEDAKRLLFMLLADPTHVDRELVLKTKIRLSMFASDKLVASYDAVIDHILANAKSGKAMTAEDEALIDEFNRLVKIELGVK